MQLLNNKHHYKVEHPNDEKIQKCLQKKPYVFDTKLVESIVMKSMLCPVNQLRQTVG